MNGTEGVHCPGCGSLEHTVVDCHAVGYFIRRYRECRNCGVRFATREVVENGEQKKTTSPPGKSLTLCHVRSAP